MLRFEQGFKSRREGVEYDKTPVQPCGGGYLSQALSVVLALALATTMCVWPTSGTTQAYAESTATTPSLSTYADNQALTDTTFAPNAEGTPNYVGTINFGKGADDNAASWYLLGGDGENVDVLAAVSLADDEAFQEKGLDGGMSEAGFTPDTDTWNDVIYVNGTKPSKVWWNNYGASDARVTLKKLATNTSKFTSVEQDMMNTTTVETTDVMNKTTDGSAYLTYKTTDTLYLAETGKYVSIAPPYFQPLSDVPINVNNKTLNLAYYPGNISIGCARRIGLVLRKTIIWCFVQFRGTIMMKMDIGMEFGRLELIFKLK